VEKARQGEGSREQTAEELKTLKRWAIERLCSKVSKRGTAKQALQNQKSPEPKTCGGRTTNSGSKR
jgi:hypothetical protein